MAATPPTLPGRYHDPRPVGRGGMANIFRATDSELGRTVAVKVLADHCAEDDDVRERFLREARAAARLSGDPNTVTIYDVGETEGCPYLVMEYLPGGSLAARLAAGRIDRELAMQWLDQAARALDTAHEHGVVHRDVKPGNLLLDGDDNVYVADFGVARATGVDSNTQTGVILGTVGYLAPEQAAGGQATAASDRYALAVVAHELLTGMRPGPTPSSKLPAPAHHVFARALAEDPACRYSSCLDFVDALAAALAPSVPVTAPTAVLVRRRRRRAPLAIATALALGVLAFVLTAALTDGNAAKAPPTVVQTVTAPAPQRAAATPTPARPVSATSARAPAHHGKAKGHKKHKHGKG